VTDGHKSEGPLVNQSFGRLVENFDVDDVVMDGHKSEGPLVNHVFGRLVENSGFCCKGAGLGLEGQPRFEKIKQA